MKQSSPKKRVRNADAKSVAAKKPLPLVGPITYYLPIKDGLPSVKSLDGEQRLIAAAELRVVRGEFEGMDRFYAAIRKDGRNFLTAAEAALLGAVGANNAVLFDQVLKDIAAYPERYGMPEAKLAVEIAMLWVRNFLKAPLECPEWLVNLDLASIPGEWRRQVAYISVLCLKRKHEYTAASVLAESLLNLESSKEIRASAEDIFLKMAKAKICREEGRMKDAERWCRAVVESVKPYGIVLPFLGVMMGPKSVLERVMAAEAPEILAKVKKLTNRYLRNLIHYHNRYTGDEVSEELTPREFYLLQQLKRGLSYKEIAERLGISAANVHNLVIVAYEKLHIRNSRAIGSKVW